MPAITTTATAAAVASSASLLSVLFPYILPQPPGSFFCFIFLFHLLTSSFLFHSHPLLLAPSSRIALVAPLLHAAPLPCAAPSPRAAPLPHTALRHVLPSPLPCRAALAASPLACVASVALCLRHTLTIFPFQAAWGGLWHSCMLLCCWCRPWHRSSSVPGGLCCQACLTAGADPGTAV
jgi:hypothetical protein